MVYWLESRQSQPCAVPRRAGAGQRPCAADDGGGYWIKNRIRSVDVRMLLTATLLLSVSGWSRIGIRQVKESDAGTRVSDGLRRGAVKLNSPSRR
jgi:hypothetical protein